jgi:alpha-tubulin suppressor-like RCC1 family protein
VRGIDDARTIVSSAAHAIAVETAGWAFGLGDNNDCKLGGAVGGLPFNTKEGWPELVPAFDAGVDAATGVWHTLLLRSDGTVWPLGEGSLGFGTWETRCTATPIPSFSLADNAWLLSDTDGDGVPAWREYVLGTDPLDADSNNDGIADGVESSTASGRPDYDLDDDGILNDAEAAAGTDPFAADSDGDGYADGVDAFPLDPTRHEPLEPAVGDVVAPTITLIEPSNAVPRP